jgi:N-methylhydantoinase B
VNALPPGAVYSRTDVGQRLVDMTLGALARAIPERICAGSTGGILVTTSGVDPRTGRYYVYNESNGGGMGARQGFDGLDAVQVHTTNTANLPVEAAELEYPIQIMSYELVRDSGGAGAFRGGMTMRKTIRVRDHDAVLWSGGTCAKVAPVGLFGGGDGTLCRADLSPGAQPIVKRKGALRAGESVAVQAASGAGFGDPRARDRAAVARDLREDRISPAAAREIYGLDRDTVDEIVAARG